MSKELIKKLKNIKMKDGLVNPDRVWVVQNRAKLLANTRQSAMQMQAEAQPEKTAVKIVAHFSEVLDIFFSRRVLSFARSSLTVFLVGAVAVSS